MASFRQGLSTIGGYKIIETLDYSKGINGLPKSDVLKFILENGSTVVVRPSGTEPKLKMYCCIKANDEAESMKVYEEISKDLSRKFK